MSFSKLVDQGAPFAELSRAADALDETARQALLDEMTPKRLKALFQLAAGGTTAVTPAYLVPTSTPPGHTVIWYGKNNVPLFRRFQKRFARGDEATGGALIGHNFNGTWIATVFGGPGYFLALPNPDRPSEFLFDYTKYPARSPPGWPAVSGNRTGTHVFVYGLFNDLVRPVGNHLAVGATFTQRRGKSGGAYFVLVRGETRAL